MDVTQVRSKDNDDDDDDLYIIGAVCDEKVTLREKLTHENCSLPTIHLGPAGRRPAWAY